MDKDSKIKFIPAIITLIAAAITVVINIILQVDFGIFVKRLFFCVIIFYVIGYIFYIVMNLALNNKKDVGILESEAEDSSSDGATTEDSASEEDEDDE